MPNEPTLKMTPEPRAMQSRGFPGLSCLHCGETDCVSLNLHDFSTYCKECDHEGTLDEVCEILGRWEKVLAWVELAPIAE